MYEFHGWITIQAAAAATEQEQLEALIPKIQLRITEFSWGSGLLSLNAANGSYYLHVGGFTKEKGQEAEEILSLYRYIGEIAPRSYGLLYSWDRDSRHAEDNEFRVLVLARGQMKEQRDPFLSPCVPVIRDEVD